MDPRAWSAEPPVGPGGAPPGVPGQGQIELFRLVRVRGIFGHGAKQKNAAGDLGAQERAPAADPFAPAVILEKALSRCQGKNATFHDLSGCQAAATAVRHVVIAAARSARCVWAERRWRWTLKVL